MAADTQDTGTRNAHAGIAQDAMNRAAGSVLDSAAHGAGLDVFEETVNTCREQIEELISSKTDLKNKFFRMVRTVMYAAAGFFCVSIIASFIVFGIAAYAECESFPVIAGAVTTLVSSFATMLVSIFKLPEIIATYLFDKEENNIVKDIIKTVQDYERDLARMKHEEAVNAAMDAVDAGRQSVNAEAGCLTDSPHSTDDGSLGDRIEPAAQGQDSVNTDAAPVQGNAGTGA